MKAQVIERDVVLVPSGWDSWGKLRVLREGFDCEAVNQGWDTDMDAVIDRQQPGAHGARGIYEEVISDPLAKDQVRNKKKKKASHFLKKNNNSHYTQCLRLSLVRMNKHFWIDIMRH